MRKNYDHQRLWGCDESLNKMLADQLKEKRLSLGITQRQLAKKMGIRQPTVSGIENARDNITLTKLVRYLAALGLDAVVKFDSDKKKLSILCHLFKASWNKVNIHVPCPGTYFASLDHKSNDFFRPWNVFPDPKNFKTIQDEPPLDKTLSGKEIGCHSQLPIFN